MLEKEGWRSRVGVELGTVEERTIMGDDEDHLARCPNCRNRLSNLDLEL